MIIILYLFVVVFLVFFSLSLMVVVGYPIMLLYDQYRTINECKIIREQDEYKKFFRELKYDYL